MRTEVPAAANAGLRRARSDRHDALLLNADTLVAPGFLPRLWLCARDVTWLFPLRGRGAHLVDSTRLGRIKEGPERRVAMLRAEGIDALNTGIPFPQLDEGLAYRLDSVLGEGFALLGSARISPGVNDRLVRLGLVRIQTVSAAVQQWLDSHHATAVLVRPDRLVAALETSPGAIDTVVNGWHTWSLPASTASAGTLDKADILLA